MKFKNTQKAIINLGTAESIRPFEITRDYTRDEIEKSIGIRAAIDKGYLVALDRATAAKLSAPVARKSPEWVAAPDTMGGTLKSETTSNGNKIEYIVADDEGVDSVSTPSGADFVTSIPADGTPDKIEQGYSARKSASDYYEEQLMAESGTEMDLDDEAHLAEGEMERPVPLDADEEIIKDVSQIVKSQGKLAADVQTVHEAAIEGIAKSAHEVNETTKPDYDDGETVPSASAEVQLFLAKQFDEKKWVLNKSIDSEFLKAALSHTQSDNLKELLLQRISELEK